MQNFWFHPLLNTSVKTVVFNISLFFGTPSTFAKQFISILETSIGVKFGNRFTGRDMDRIIEARVTGLKKRWKTGRVIQMTKHIFQILI